MTSKGVSFQLSRRGQFSAVVDTVREEGEDDQAIRPMAMGCGPDQDGDIDQVHNDADCHRMSSGEAGYVHHALRSTGPCALGLFSSLWFPADQPSILMEATPSLPFVRPCTCSRDGAGRKAGSDRC